MICHECELIGEKACSTHGLILFRQEIEKTEQRCRTYPTHALAILYDIEKTVGNADVIAIIRNELKRRTK